MIEWAMNWNENKQVLQRNSSKTTQSIHNKPETRAWLFLIDFLHTFVHR